MKRNTGYLFIAMMSLITTQCLATLGESSASIQVDRSILNATKPELSTDHPLYKIESYQLSSVTNVREYVAKDDKVFAVTWSGPLKPDLHQLLGKHYPTLTAAIAKKPHGGRSPVFIKRRDIVIESGGHQRSFFGRAYLPAAMPSGMRESDIQ
jgi:hypothetical protein